MHLCGQYNVKVNLLIEQLNNIIILKKMLFIWQEKDKQRTRTKHLLFIRYNEQMCIMSKTVITLYNRL